MEELLHSVIKVAGIPGARVSEVVRFEPGYTGIVLSLTSEHAEILPLSGDTVPAGTRVARTGRLLEVFASTAHLGTTVDPLGALRTGKRLPAGDGETRSIDRSPQGIMGRASISKPLPTGVSVVDTLVPLGVGQREMVIGDRQTGKTAFLKQAVQTQARMGTICIWAAIGKKRAEIKRLREFFVKAQILPQTVIVATDLMETPGMVYLTPYTAMALAEYFRDQGKDVLVVLDDLTNHAKNYRELSLLSKRFPGRDSYPGDIFYTHSRLIERAGNFQTGSISCFAVAESVEGDFAGYIQSNIMSMTDGHIYFDTELFDQGQRPAVNTFVSVTRVGGQVQPPLHRDARGQVEAFMVKARELREFMHFGAELSEKVRASLALADRVEALFEQDEYVSVLPDATLFILAGLWTGKWKELGNHEAQAQMRKVIERFNTDEAFQGAVLKINGSVSTFEDLLKAVKPNESLFST